MSNIFVGINGTAKRVSKAYVGVADTARKIKKAYIGVGGTARLCYAGSGGTVNCYGTATPLSQPRASASGAAAGEYALFVGGDSGSVTGSMYNTADAYSQALVRTAATSISSRSGAAAVSASGSAIFAGGYRSPSASTNYPRSSSSVEKFSPTLEKTTLAALAETAADVAGAQCGTSAFFAGGMNYNDAVETLLDSVCVYDADGVKTSASPLSSARSCCGGAACGTNVLFGGGKPASDMTDAVDVYASDGTRTSSLTLSAPLCPTCASTPRGAVFFPGVYNSKKSPVGVADCFDSALVRHTVTLPSPVYRASQGAVLGDIALFAGVATAGFSVPSADVFAIDTSSFTLVDAPSMSSARLRSAAAVTGAYAIFAGGQTAATSGVCDTADVYFIS